MVNGEKIIKVLLFAAGGFLVYNTFFKKKAFALDSATELKRLAEQNTAKGIGKPSAAHVAIANQIWENFNHAIVKDSNEDRIVALFKGSTVPRSVSDMSLIYQAYGVRKLPERIDFDIFGVGFSSGSLIQHVERIFDQDRSQTGDFIALLNTVLSYAPADNK
ncbi:hypothetical protein [Chitinophaga qingshengii]|uniref:DUF4359 domain-containing protein n=1 Tax=Chitinophaga qingshengii TaxID=1569794 RepID=A0ABR7TS59_9BACT|nr:hypothetical protein [Chitinophaga qingshengii]MBC9933321.1 hypothetical protein [Chitinophaga qingshengii]